MLGLLLAGALGLTSHACALEWARDAQSINVPALAKSVDVTFTYHNVGAKPVTIRAVETNCDCLQAAPDKTLIAPGERGEIRARFVVGDRSGGYERFITVHTDDRPTPQRLRIHLEVAEPAEVSPLNLVWEQDSPAEEKVAEVRVSAGVEIEFKDTFSTNAAFTARLETVRNGHHYRLHVKPTTTAAAANAAIRAQGVAANGDKIVVSAYANIR